MNKYENLGFTTIVTDDKLKIEIPIDNLVTAFEFSPNNIGEVQLKKDCEKLLADFVAKHILQECDQETGDTYISNAIDQVFDLILEGYENGDGFIIETEQD